MKRILTSLTRKRYFKPLAAADAAIASFTRFERILFIFASLILTGAALTGFIRAQSFFLNEVPDFGGTLHESSYGVPRFINPLLAATDADRDLVALVYSGLMRQTKDGLIPDLAERYTVSEDGLEYRFWLRPDATFHDGEKVSAYDIEYTLTTAIDPAIKSPKRAVWDGVSIEVINQNELVIRLSQPYARFLENATIGILPQHLWEDVSTDEFPHTLLNLEPIGSGPYQFDTIARSDAGIPTTYYLDSFNDFALGEPYIRQVTMDFFADEQSALTALERGDIDLVHGISPVTATTIQIENVTVRSAPLPRVFGMFFNGVKNPVFTDRTVREILSDVIDREAIVRDVLRGFADSTSLPLPADFGYASEREPISLGTAEAALEAGGWKKNSAGIRERTVDGAVRTLSFTITVPNIDEIVAVAAAVKDTWAKLGADVTINTVPQDDISFVIRPREFEALLFGQVVGWTPDLYAFWHSSQRTDPGLNITGYANIESDAALARARATDDKDSQMGYHETFLKEIDADAPAAFIYSPRLILAINDRILGVTIERASVPADRFSMIHTWHIETDHVWDIFQD